MHFSCLDLKETDVNLIHSLFMINPTVHFPKRKKNNGWSNNKNKSIWNLSE